ncbi:MAG: GspH/FimT family pseudopilin [bacterium]
MTCLHGVSTSRSRAGMTLVELAVMLAVFGIVLAASAPSLHSILEGYRHRNAVDSVKARLVITRGLAVSTKIPHVVTVDPVASRLFVFADTDADGVFDAGERSRGPFEVDPGVNLVNVDWAQNQISFRPDGTASQTGSIRVQDDDGRSKTIRVSSMTGSAQVLP